MVLCEDLQTVVDNPRVTMNEWSNTRISELSWAEQDILENYGPDELLKFKQNCRLDSPQKILEVKAESTVINEKTEVKDEASVNRNMSLEFIDSANEEKFELLVKEKKIKYQFKRRHSGSSSIESRSTSPNDKQDISARHRIDQKRPRQGSVSSSSTSSSSYIEADPATLGRRQKQIDYGKNTIAYDRYVEAVPRAERTKDHPRTPNKYGKYSRRAFDGLIKIWRKQLHCFDPPSTDSKKIEEKIAVKNEPKSDIAMPRKEPEDESNSDSDFDW